VKAAQFDYVRPSSLELAIEHLGSGGGSAKILAGGQSLGPMLNLRLAAPELLVDVTRIPELLRVEDEGDAVVLGACVTHAAIEDGETADGTRGVMPRVARGIAYRAVRNRGTLGGSLAHADPSSDWISSLGALDATAMIFGGQGRRTVPIAELMVGAFETSLAPGEILEAVRIPKVSARARWGFHKVCRKAGELAEAIAAVLWDPERGIERAVIGATGSVPIVIKDALRLHEGRRDKILDGTLGDSPEWRRLQAHAGLGVDSYERQIHLVALRRALVQAYKP
jgi:aerobic carbon-monoxide dehydrogenase medium subunit